MARRRRRWSAAYGGGVRGAGWRTVMNDSVKKLPCYDPKLQVRRTDTPVCTASRCQPGAAPPARRPQHHRRPPSTLDRPRRAGPPATQEATATSRTPPSPLRPSSGSVATGLQNRAGTTSPSRSDPSVGRDPHFGLVPLDSKGPRTTLKIERGGCWIATVIDSSMTEGCSMHGFVLAPR